MSANAHAPKVYLIEYAAIRQALAGNVTIEGCTRHQVAVVLQLLKYRTVKTRATEAEFVRELSGSGLIANEDVVNALNGLVSSGRVTRYSDTYGNGSGALRVDVIELANLREDILRNDPPLNFGDITLGATGKPLPLEVFNDAGAQPQAAASSREAPVTKKHDVLVLRDAIKEGLIKEGTLQAKVFRLACEGVQGTAEMARKLDKHPAEISHVKTVLENKGIIKRIGSGRHGRPSERKSTPKPVEEGADSIDGLISKLEKRVEEEKAALETERGKLAGLESSIKAREERLTILESQKGEAEKMKEKLREMARVIGK